MNLLCKIGLHYGPWIYDCDVKPKNRARPVSVGDAVRKALGFARTCHTGDTAGLKETEETETAVSEKDVISTSEHCSTS